jgi:Flp pilus assembly protein TadD
MQCMTMHDPACAACPQTHTKIYAGASQVPQVAVLGGRAYGRPTGMPIERPTEKTMAEGAASASGPSRWEAVKTQGNTLFAAGDLKGAIEQWRAAQALAVEEFGARGNRAAAVCAANASVALLKFGQAEEALASAHEAANHDLSYSKAHIRAANALRQLGRHAEVCPVPLRIARVCRTHSPLQEVHTHSL